MLYIQHEAFKTNLFNDGGFFYYLIGDKNTYLEFNYKENVTSSTARLQRVPTSLNIENKAFAT